MLQIKSDVFLGTEYGQAGFSKRRKQSIISGDKIPLPKMFCCFNFQLGAPVLSSFYKVFPLSAKVQSENERMQSKNH